MKDLLNIFWALYRVITANIYCRLKVLYLCRKYKMKYPRISLMALRGRNLGKHIPGHIMVDIKKQNFFGIKNTLLHEFRHEWQAQKYPDWYEWWRKLPEYNQDEFYKYTLIEMDANRFEESRGVLDDEKYISAFTLGELQYFYECGLLPNLCRIVF